MKALGLHTFEISKGMINEKTFIDLLSMDNDFTVNADMFREDTLELGYKSEAERISKETFEIYKEELSDRDTEAEALENALKEIIDNADNFIGHSSYYGYGDYILNIIETDYTYVVALAYLEGQ